MSVQVRNILIALGLILGISFILGYLGAGSMSVWPAVFIGAFAWYLLSNLANNRKVNNLPDAERNAALASPPPPGTGLVYIFREGFVGKALGIDIGMDNRAIAQLKSPRFTVVAVAPGEHILAAGTKGFAGAQNKGGAASFLIHEGEVVVFQVAIDMGLMQNSVKLTRHANTNMALSKLSQITMVAPEQPDRNSPVMA